MLKTLFRWLMATLGACAIFLLILLCFGWLLQNNEAETRALVEELKQEQPKSSTQ